MPYDDELDAGCIKDVMDKLQPEDFYIKQNRDVFETIYTMFSYSKPIDGVTVAEEMQKNGSYDENTTRSYLAQLMEITPTSANVMEYVSIVRDKALLRAFPPWTRRSTASTAPTSSSWPPGPAWARAPWP